MRPFRALAAVLLFAAPAAAQEKLRQVTVVQLMLVAHPPVQAELQLSEAQAQRVRDFAARQRQALRGLGNAPPAELRKQLAALDRATERFLAEVLKPDQAHRLRQITLQVAGPLAYDDPEVTRALNLTAAQRAQIRAIEDDARRQVREVLQGKGERDELRRRSLEVLRRGRERLVAVLDPAQRARWDALVGKPYRGDFPPALPGGRP